MDAQLILTLGLSLDHHQCDDDDPVADAARYPDAPTRRRPSPSGPLLLNQARTYAFLMALLLAGAVYVFLTRTDLGKALRAAADDPEAASYQGINVRAMHGVAFGVGIALVAAAGGLLATYYPIEPNVAVNFIVLMFVAVVLGGLGSIPGAFVGGIVDRPRPVAHAAGPAAPAPERGRLRRVPGRPLRPAAGPLRPPRPHRLTVAPRSRAWLAIAAVVAGGPRALLRARPSATTTAS